MGLGHLGSVTDEEIRADVALFASGGSLQCDYADRERLNIHTAIARQFHGLGPDDSNPDGDVAYERVIKAMEAP